jgi:predicted RNase H-like nuclease (RuvC/YqgF family)
MEPNQIVEAVTNVRDIEALKHECASIKTVVETLKSELAAKDAALVTAKTELAKIEALESELEKANAEKTATAERIVALEKDLEIAKTEASELATKLGTHELADRIAARLDALKNKDLLVDEAADATAVASLSQEAFESFVADRERVIASVKARVTSDSPSADPIAAAEKQVLEVMSTTASARPTEQPQVSPYTLF